MKNWPPIPTPAQRAETNALMRGGGSCEDDIECRGQVYMDRVAIANNKPLPPRFNEAGEPIDLNYGLCLPGR